MDNINFKESVSTNIEGINFRPLIDEDIPNIIQLGAKQYAYHNKALDNFNLTFEDNLNVMKSSDYVKILEQGMSFGAFKDGKLIGFALGCDNAIDTDIEIQLSQNVQRVFSLLATLDEKNSNPDQGYCFFLMYLATDHEFEGKGLGTVCFNMSCKSAIQKGFKTYFVYAFHPGTKRITEKHFKKTQIVGEKLLENGASIWSIKALF